MGRYSMSKLHVLILPSWYPTESAPLNGVFFQEQAKALFEAGVKVGVIYPELRSLRQLGLRSMLENHFQITAENEEGVCTYRLAAWNVPLKRVKGYYQAYLFKKLFQDYINKHGVPDIIHVHSALWAGLSAMRIKREYKIPYMLTEHSTAYARGLLSKYELSITKKIFLNADAMVAVSRPFARLLEEELRVEPIKVIPNIVDTKFFICTNNIRSKKQYTFLTIAFLTEKKAIDILLRAFEKEFNNNPNVRLVIGGDGDKRRELETLAMDLGISSQVEFLGPLNRHEVRDAMCKSNAFVLPSYYETFGVVLIEAMSTGMPVIATRSGGPEDIINDKVGVLIKPGSIDHLAQAMRQVISQTYSMQEIRNYVKKYSKEQVINNIIQEYHKIIYKSEKRIDG